MPKVFVFGTLKKGFPLHPKGLAGARFLGPYQTVEPYPVVVAGSFFGPMMFDEPGRGVPVRGELYEVEEERLPTLDELEDVGEPGSFRSTVRVEPVGGGLAVEAIGFMKSPELAVPVHTGYLGDYQDRRFVPPWERKEG